MYLMISIRIMGCDLKFSTRLTLDPMLDALRFEILQHSTESSLNRYRDWSSSPTTQRFAVLANVKNRFLDGIPS